jgi:hypothetical protein
MKIGGEINDYTILGWSWVLSLKKKIHKIWNLAPSWLYEVLANFNPNYIKIIKKYLLKLYQDKICSIW